MQIRSFHFGPKKIDVSCVPGRVTKKGSVPTETGNGKWRKLKRTRVQGKETKERVREKRKPLTRNPKPETTETTGNVGKEKKVGDASSSGDSVPQPPVSGANPELNELLHEASTLMKSLRPVLKAVHVREGLKKANTETIQTGLLDGGATNALRKGSKEEIARAEMVTVELASGTTQLYQDMSTGTLLTTSNVEPIVPLRGIVDLGYKIKWDRRGCVVMHPIQGKLTCWLRNGCPVVREEHALQLIWDMEDMERRRRSQPKLAGETVSDEVRVWWHKNFPEVPSNVVSYMTGQQKGKPDGKPFALE